MSSHRPKRAPTATEALSRQQHACTLIDPAEEGMLRECGAIVGQWCNRLQARLDSIRGVITELFFFSYHDEFRLVLGWADPDAAHFDAVHRHCRYVPQTAAGGLSRVVTQPRWTRSSALFLRPDVGEWIVSPDRFERIPGSTGRTMDDVFDREIGLRDRLYLPAHGPSGEIVGAFVARIAGTGEGPVTSELRHALQRAVVQYDAWKGADIIADTLPILRQTWGVAWRADRECRTFLPHQASLTRVIASILRSDFYKGRPAYVGVAHFDFNDFKRLNDLAGYKGADAVVDEFVRAAVMAFSKWDIVAAWPHPVSGAAGSWAALSAHGAGRPRVAWYLARVGGDEFGFAWISDEPALSQIRTRVLEKAARDAEARIPATFREEGSKQWRLRCIGAYVEADAGSFEDRSPGGERRKQDHAEQLWSFVTRASQTAKREYKARWDDRWPSERVAFVDLDDLLTGFRERYSVGEVPADAAHSALAGAWEVPFPELRDYLPIVPHDERLRVITSTRGGSALLCRYEDPYVPAEAAYMADHGSRAATPVRSSGDSMLVKPDSAGLYEAHPNPGGAP